MAFSKAPGKIFRANIGQYSKSSLQPVVNYVPRPGLHQKINEKLRDHQGDGIETMQKLLLWGLGGAGKSQLVLNYIREHGHDYSAVFWIEAESKGSIERDYTQIYQLLYNHQTGAIQETLKAEIAMSRVKSWFHKSEGRWLVVLHSADTIDDDQDRSYIDLRNFIPDAPGVHTIITSQSSTPGEIKTLESVEVTKMELAEATELFQLCAKIQDQGKDVEMEVCKIVIELGCSALAITLAGSYVSITPRLSSDVRKYLPEYHQQQKELLSRRPEQQIHRYGESVLSTWEASFDSVATQNPVAARLLSVMAFINSDDIFLGLFDQSLDGFSQQSHTTPSPFPTWRLFLASEADWNLHTLKSAFETLQRYSLIQWESDQESYIMHKLLHTWGQDRLETDEQWRCSGVALELLADATANDQLSQSYKLRLVPHLMANFGIYLEGPNSIRELTRDRLAFIEKIEGFLYAIGRLSEAYEIQLFHFRKTKETLGEEHPVTLTSMNTLALVSSSQGKYEEAERIYRQASVLSKTLLGNEHPETLKSMESLADVLGSQGVCQEVEGIRRQILVSRQKLLGEKHPDTLRSMTALALILSSQGKYEEAEEIYRQVTVSYETVLGKKHPDTLTSINNLAGSLSNRGKYNEAERIHRQTLALCRTMLGEEHPDTLCSMNNLASVLNGQGKYHEAEGIQRQVLATREMVLGEEHPDTLRSMNNLASVLNGLGEYDEAERILRQVLALQKTLLGEKHPTTFISMNNLAEVLDCQSKDEEAERIHRQTLELREMVLGKEHPDTLGSMNNLAEVLESQGKYGEAEQMHRHTLALLETVLDKDHPSTLTSMNNLAGVLSDQSKYGEAERIYRQTLASRKRVLGKEHVSTLESMNNLAGVLREKGKYREAEKIHREEWGLCMTVLGKGHPDTLTSRNNLVSVLMSRGKDAEAKFIQKQDLS